MITRDKLIEILSRWVDSPDTIADIILKQCMIPGHELWVVAKPGLLDNYHVIYTTITAVTLDRKGVIRVTVEGYYQDRYNDHSRYNTSFPVTSLGTKLFFNEAAAYNKCEELNRNGK